MPRTTLNLDPTVLEELRERAEAENLTLGEVASRLLAQALGATATPRKPRKLGWHTSSKGARVDLDDPRVLKDWAYGTRDVPDD